MDAPWQSLQKGARLLHRTNPQTLATAFLALLSAIYLGWTALDGLLGHASELPLGALTGVDEAKPFYDIVAIIYSTASVEDKSRLEAARTSWLKEKEFAGLSFWYVVLICVDDPGAWRLLGEPNVAVVPCRHGYSSLVTKGIEGFKYIAANLRFNYVLKTDIDTVVPLGCIARTVLSIDREQCPSFGIGRWYSAGQSQVWQIGDMPYGPKYHNEAYKHDTGNTFYNPYASGWAVVWSADVARFLGMFGKPRGEAPAWRTTWTIDDAAIGTFIIGLDICRVSLNCVTPSGVASEDVAMQSSVIVDDKATLPVGPGAHIEGFEGPLSDDVPGLGDLMNVHASGLGNCASRCNALKGCQSFEYSPTVKEGEPIANCQIATGSTRSGLQYGDFVLYLKQAAPQPNIAIGGAGMGVAKPPQSGPLPVLENFKGPFKDDVPGIGDIANIQVHDVEACARRCRTEPTCKSFEFSPTARILAPIKNCQVATGSTRAGVQHLDFVLYLKDG